MKVLEADLQELLVGQHGPRKFPARHDDRALEAKRYAAMVSRQTVGDNNRTPRLSGLGRQPRPFPESGFQSFQYRSIVSSIQG
jgi:hypothetical protein